MNVSEIRCGSCGVRNRVPVRSTGRPRCAKCHADLAWLGEVSEADFDGAVASSPVPVLVDLWAPWCGPCRSIAPVLEELAAQRAGQLRIAKVNVDEAPGVSARLGVQGIPTMVLYADGAEVDRQVGALPGHAISSWIDRSLSQRGAT